LKTQKLLQAKMPANTVCRWTAASPLQGMRREPAKVLVSEGVLPALLLPLNRRPLGGFRYSLWAQANTQKDLTK
jgi:hypothetical protein